MKEDTLSSSSNSLHVTLIRLSKEHKRRSRQEFNKISISEGYPKILNYLSENNGCIQKDIANNYKIEPATVTSLLANMDRDGLIVRTQNPENRRILNVYLTEKGKKAQKEVERTFNLLDEECFKGFSEEEKESALEILNRIYDNLIRKEDQDV